MNSTIERLHNSDKGLTISIHPQRIEGLDLSPADDGYIIYQAEQDRVHYLNPTAVVILELCNGQNSVEEIVEMVKQGYDLPEAPVEVVSQALAQLSAEGLLEQRSTASK